MAEQSRDELKRNFRNGTLVKENHFVNLIDSFVHKSDLNIKEGTTIHPGLTPTDKKYFSFFKDGVDQQKNLPTLSLETTHDNNTEGEGISLVVPGAEGCYRNLVSFKSETDRNGNKFGRIGVNTANPTVDLDVNGRVGMKSRIGKFGDPEMNPHEIIADGNWHNLLTNLKGITVLEIALSAYCPSGRYAMYYAVITNVLGKGSSVNPMQRLHSSWWHRLQLQWTKSVNGQYGLRVRTASGYKTKPMIYNRITNLWN
jgi:hypothetical protein